MKVYYSVICHCECNEAIHKENGSPRLFQSLAMTVIAMAKEK